MRLKRPFWFLACGLLALGLLSGCGGTALMEAAGRGDLTQVQKLTQKGADLEDKGLITGEYKTPLQMAAESGHLEVVRYLLAQGADPNALGAYGVTALYLTAEYSHLDCVQALVQGGADIHQKSFFRRTALHGAAIKGDLKIINYLLDHGAEINATAFEGYTPLMLAAYHGRPEAIRLLLMRGADPSPKNADGETALAVARRKGQKTAVQALKQGATLGIHYQDIQGQVGYHLYAQPQAKCGATWTSEDFQRLSGSLPPGLRFDYSRIEGTPTQPGSWQVTVKFSGVKCKGQRYADEVVTIAVNIKGYAPRRVD
jgi:ankyrin repeat protein